MVKSITQIATSGSGGPSDNTTILHEHSQLQITVITQRYKTTNRSQYSAVCVSGHQVCFQKKKWCSLHRKAIIPALSHSLLLRISLKSTSAIMSKNIYTLWPLKASAFPWQVAPESAVFLRNLHQCENSSSSKSLVWTQEMLLTTELLCHGDWPDW